MEAVNLKQGIQVALQICIEETCIEVEETFMQRLSAIFFFFGDKKQLLRTLLTCTFILFLIEFFRFDLLQFRIEGKIHTEAVADVSKDVG